MNYPVVITYPIPGRELAAVLRAPAVRSYLVSKGWIERPAVGPSALVFAGPTGDDGTPITQLVPLPSAPDYLMRLEDLMLSLSHFEDRDARAILADILSQPVETLAGAPGVVEPAPRTAVP